MRRVDARSRLWRGGTNDCHLGRTKTTTTAAAIAASGGEGTKKKKKKKKMCLSKCQHFAIICRRLRLSRAKSVPDAIVPSPPANPWLNAERGQNEVDCGGYMMRSSLLSGHKRQFEESFYNCDDHPLPGNENGSSNLERLDNIITFHLESCKGPCNHDNTKMELFHRRICK